MAIPVNPYVAGNPVGDSPAFIGRADVLREVLRVLRRPQDNAIVLYGQRRIGKTSILQHLAALLPREGPYRPVYFDLQDKADWPLDRVLQDLAHTIAHTLSRPAPNLDSDPETTFQEWLPAVLDDLPEGSSLVLLFDEFDVLADPQKEQAAAAFFPYLRGLLASDPQRLQFVFVIGRNVDDLANIALSLFKGTPYQRVSLLDQEDTADLVRLSEANDTLHWPDEAVERVWQLTHGHPFLTQQLCSHVWERAYDEEPEKPPTVARVGVDAAVPEALEASRNTMVWLWDGLGPAERVVASALAEAGPDPITEEALEHLLRESGVRVIIRELQNAPQLLQDWDILEPADSGYRFRVELLRRWMAENKPLRRVQEELDRIEPVAESFYQAALGLYRGGQLDQATDDLKRAIGLNPNHVRANQLLADILLAQGQAGEARQLLERLYKYQPAAARSRLVQAYLTQVQAVENYDEQLALYERVLELDPTQPEAITGPQRILTVRENTPHLSAWNPLDHLRLLWWVLVIPQRLKVYLVIFEENEVRVVGRWLVSTLIWLPFFVLALALGLGLLPRTEDASPSNIFLSFNIWFLICWALVGYRFREKMNSVWNALESIVESIVERMVARDFSVTSISKVVVAVLALVVAICTTIAIFGFVLILSMVIVSGIFAFIVVGDILGLLALVVAFYVVLGVAGGVAFGMEDHVPIYVTGALAFFVMVGVSFAMTVTFEIAGIATQDATFKTVIITAIIVACSAALSAAKGTEKSLKTGRPSWQALGAFGVLVLAHAFLIWFSFLGGWRVFQ